MQDFLELDNTARMNTPSTVGNNWKWRMEKGSLNDELINKIAELTNTFDRNRYDDKEK